MLQFKFNTAQHFKCQHHVREELTTEKKTVLHSRIKKHLFFEITPGSRL